MGSGKGKSCSWSEPTPEFPKDGIALWSGSVASIPENWTLCDGTQGTPNLQNRFVPTAGDTYAKGETGGSINHDHSIIEDPLVLLDDGDIPHNFPTGPIAEGFVNHDHGGVTGEADGRPIFYALCYIMRTI